MQYLDLCRTSAEQASSPSGLFSKPAGVKALKRLPHLQTLLLAWCRNLKPDDVAALAKALPKLQVLDLSLTRTDAPALASVARELAPSLQALNLCGCKSVGTGAMASVAQLQELTTLDLSHLPSLTDDAVHGLVDALPRLLSISIAECEGLSEECRQGIRSRVHSSVTRVWHGTNH